jgi:hypothetical protein
MMHRPQVISNEALAIGYAGAYGSFMLHARRAAEKFGVDARDILIEMGRRKTVGGQEDLIIDVAIDLAKAKRCNNTKSRPAEVRSMPTVFQPNSQGAADDGRTRPRPPLRQQPRKPYLLHRPD